MKLTAEDYTAGEAELNEDALARADAQFGNRPLHQRGIDQVWHDIAAINRPVLPVITAIATAHVNAMNKVANDEREPLVEGGQGRDASDVADTGNAITAFVEVALWVGGATAFIVAMVKGCA